MSKTYEVEITETVRTYWKINAKDEAQAKRLIKKAWEGDALEIDGEEDKTSPFFKDADSSELVKGGLAAGDKEAARSIRGEDNPQLIDRSWLYGVDGILPFRALDADPITDISEA
jgi:hypothetical protein